MAQYPTLDILEKCAIMQNFQPNTLLAINDMWESVKGETFKVWVIILILAIVVLVAIFVVIYRKRDKFKWLKLPQKTSNKMIKKGYKIIKKENLIK